MSRASFFKIFLLILFLFIVFGYGNRAYTKNSKQLKDSISNKIADKQSKVQGNNKNLSNSGGLSKDATALNDSKIYDDISSYQRFLQWSDEKEMISNQILKIIENHGKYRSLLDIGTGDGELTKYLTDSFKNICCIEPNTALINLLKKRFTGGKYSSKNFMFINKPFEGIKFEKKFDVILSSYSFQYLKNPKKELRRVKNLLKDEGVFLLIAIEPCELWDFHIKYRQSVPNGKIIKPDGFDFDVKKELMKSFKIEKINFNSSITIPSVQDALNMLDFFLHVKHNNIKPETIYKVKKYLTKKYGKGHVFFDVRHGMYICRKKIEKNDVGIVRIQL